MARPPIFIQSMWRSCATYIWSKFREIDGLMAYFEPCNERLLNCERLFLHDAFDASRQVRLRHSRVQAPYFEEYPIRITGGVAGFQKRFSFECYQMDPEKDDVLLTSYLNALVANASVCGKRAVFKPCAWGLATAYLRKAIPQQTIYVLREPDAMFRSYWWFGAAGGYFLTRIVLVLAKLRDCDGFRTIADELSIPAIAHDDLLADLAEASRVADAIGPQSLRDAFIVLWALTALHNIAVADTVIDIDLLASNRQYRRQCEASIASQVGESVTFHDVTHTTTEQAPGDVLTSRARGLVRHGIAQLFGRCVAPNVTISPASESILLELGLG